MGGSLAADGVEDNAESAVNFDDNVLPIAEFDF
jgi:hypothetical protein